MIDSDIKKIKFDIENNLSHDLLAYLLVRFAPDLINFPIQGHRFINPESIKKAKKLNSNFTLYEKKYNINDDFYIDKKRNCSYSSSIELKYNGNILQYLMEIINSKKIYYYIHNIYNDSVYEWSIDYINRTNYHPLRHIYSLLAIAKTLEDISINKKKLGLNQNTEVELKQHIFNY